MSARNDTDTRRAAGDQGALLSRRQALTAAGALVAAAGVAGSASAAAGAGSQASGALLGVAPSTANAVEFRARFTQTGDTGQDFAAYGYLTYVAGASDGDLFAAGAKNESSALFTAYAQGAMAQRTVDQSVHAMDIVGTMTIYQRMAPGASYGTPDSFKDGVPVAEFDMTLQDVLTVILPGNGIPTLNGQMRQTRADGLVAGVTGRRFGRIGSKARFFATGLGTLVDPATLNSTLEMGGNWVTAE